MNKLAAAAAKVAKFGNTVAGLVPGVTAAAGAVRTVAGDVRTAFAPMVQRIKARIAARRARRAARSD